MKIRNDKLDNSIEGVIRTKIVCLLDCPNCQSKLKLIEQIRDDNTVQGQLLVEERTKK